MQKPTSVGMAKSETGLGCRQLVEVVQPYHIRHLKLGLSTVKEQELEKTDRYLLPQGKLKPQGHR
jgi:hypothetical protein